MKNHISKYHKFALWLALIAYAFFGFYAIFCARSGTFLKPSNILIYIIFIIIIMGCVLYSLNQTCHINWKHILYLVVIFTILIAYFVFLIPLTAKINVALSLVAFIIYMLIQIAFGIGFIIMVNKTPKR